MKSITDYKNIYFIGIGGIGMSALARWFNAFKYQVAGYDKTPTALTDSLIAEGIAINFEDAIDIIPSLFNHTNTLVVYTPAIPEDALQLNHFRILGNDVIKRSEALAIITANTFTIAVAGTHGKTTTSSMIAHVLRSCGVNISAFLGGITQNYNTNLLLADPNLGKQIIVVEADEYDRSFLRLSPNIGVVTTMDPDHMDIYKDEADFINTFKQFVDKISPDGFIIYKNDLPLSEAKAQNKYTFGFSDSTCNAQNIKVENGQFTFDIVQDKMAHKAYLTVPGNHNIMNALASYAVGRALDIPSEAIIKALASFRGVKRRFEYIINASKIIYIDDYAHHPTELEAFISAVKMLYPDKKLSLIFQPHLYSRTKDFMDGFASSLSMADEIILLDIYPARELPIEGVDSKVLIDKIDVKEKHLVSKENLIEFVSNKSFEILATVGAGDVDKYVYPLEKLLIKKYEL